MRSWLRRVRGALGMGLTWALAWAFGGFMFELILNILPGNDLGHIVDIWPAFFAMIGFLGGMVFSVVLPIAAGRRRFNELSISQFGVWGALGGVLLGGVAMTTGMMTGAPLLLRAAVLIVPPALLSAASAAGTLALARMAERKSLDTGTDAADMRLTEGDR